MQSTPDKAAPLNTKREAHAAVTFDRFQQGKEFSMQLEVLEDANAVAKRAAGVIAKEARTAVSARGRFLMAVSGGRTPWIMLAELVKEEVPWEHVHLFQVDERIAPAGDADRNLTRLQESLLGRVPLPSANLHAMPVEMPDSVEAAKMYAGTLERLAGHPPILDLVHLGLGGDGHTASLVPGDAVLKIRDVDVATTGIYQNRRRMTLTYPVLNRARKILWVVTGDDKMQAFQQLLAADSRIPGGSVLQDNAEVIADAAAAGTAITS